MTALAGMSSDKDTGDRHRSKRVVRLPDDIHQAISRLASRNERPIAREVKLALVAWLKQHGEWEDDAPEPTPGRPRKKGGE